MLCPKCGKRTIFDFYRCPTCSYDVVAGYNEYMANRVKSSDADTTPTTPADLPRPRPSHPLRQGVKATVSFLRSRFGFESSFRVFVVLQAIGIFALVYLSFGSRDWTWSGFLELEYWNYDHQNWLVLAAIVVPFLGAKALDWIRAAGS